jgi:activator of HSP90 ATPase
MKTKTLHQIIVFKGTAHELYEALMDSKKHAKFTNAQATISRKIGGSFHTYDDYATGKNIELVPDKKIVQTWRAADWPKDHYSKVTFVFKEKDGEITLDFTQTEIPLEAYPEIEQGWKEWYWDPLKTYLEQTT